MTPDADPARLRLLLGLALGGALLPIGFLLGGPLATAAGAGLQVAPLILIGVLAHQGRRRPGARVAAWILAAIALAVAVVGLLAVAWRAYGAEAQPVSLALGLAVTLAGATALPFAGGLVRALGLAPDDPVHRVALFLCVGLTLACLSPLLATGGRAVLLDFMRVEGMAGADTALDHLLPLLWIIPGTFALAGYGTVRGGRATWARLGLQWPTGRALALGLGVALALVPLALVAGALLEQGLSAAGVPVTRDADMERLFGLSSLTLASGLALAVAAGVGEELAIRGLLQPRLGLIGANVLFAALHAPQYTTDGVLVVFGIGLAFGALRQRTNTTVSAIAHAFYDFVLIVLALLGVDI